MLFGTKAGLIMAISSLFLGEIPGLKQKEPLYQKVVDEIYLAPLEYKLQIEMGNLEVIKKSDERLRNKNSDYETSYRWDIDEKKLTFINSPFYNWSIEIKKENNEYQAVVFCSDEFIDKANLAYIKAKKTKHEEKDSCWVNDHILEIDKEPIPKWKTWVIDRDKDGNPDEINILINNDIKKQFEEFYERVSK